MSTERLTMEDRVVPYVGIFIYILLMIISIGLIFYGPFCDFIKNENRYVQTYHKINELNMPLKWPDIIICKSPMIKDKEKYVDFMKRKYGNESEFAKLKDEVFYTKGEDFVYALSIGSTYESALNRSKLLPIKPPYIQV